MMKMNPRGEGFCLSEHYLFIMSAHADPILELSRGSRMNYIPCLSAPGQLVTRKTMQMDMLCVSLQGTSGMPSLNTRLALILQ
jgi:hypothetical protein